ncbi:methyltransferase domain-containing protein [Dactylosporangium sp. NBC_01737]|uniref:methyltransferase domain-containing protein n=1 Tax=Dactylosporangium sp. NBC_01737 TaxID=2975959 RepID=UPI002E0F408B|nr:methyltransferase domain-containing protein [Dactylosporangium sp. NBC_01737]
MTGHISAGARRWAEVLQLLAEVVPTGPAGVIVDGMDAHRGVVADRLAATLRAAGRSCVRLSRDAPPADRDGWRADGAVAVADGPHRRARPPADGWTVVVWLRTAPPAAGNGADGGGDRSGGAHVVVDLHDPDWPVIRHVDAALTDRDRWYLAESRAFFAARAATWDARFGHDQAAYAAAVTESGLPIGGTVLDAGCGTGRVLPALRAAVGATGTVVGLDVTPQMLAVARTPAAAAAAGLLLADARRLPFAAAAVDAIFAAGLIMHLPDINAGLRELARVTRPGGRLVPFHPSGRAAVAARHGRALRPGEPLAEGPLRITAVRTGWRLIRHDDPPHRFLAVARRDA